jgi:uncharacterized ion transporter superfamily protein YfcC
MSMLLGAGSFFRLLATGAGSPEQSLCIQNKVLATLSNFTRHLTKMPFVTLCYPTETPLLFVIPETSLLTILLLLPLSTALTHDSSPTHSPWLVSM